MIRVANLTKRFGRITAVDGLSFEVAKGEIVGFIGCNGAGKTTTMRILSCFMPATGGEVEIAGLDVFRDSLEVRRRVGYLPESVPLYPGMRVVEYLRYRAGIKGLHGALRRRRIDEVMVACGLSDVSRRIIGQLSKGYRQRVGLADAMVHDPQVLILDEPMIGLDPTQIRQVRGLIKDLAGRHTVLLSSHILPDVELTCERALIIHKGRLVAAESTRNLIGRMKGNVRVSVELRGPAQGDTAPFRSLDGVVGVACEPLGDWLRVTCECTRGVDLRVPLFRLAASRNWELRDLRVEERNLEDAFVAMTAEQGDAAGGEGTP